jgi:hypothetical protein
MLVTIPLHPVWKGYEETHPLLNHAIRIVLVTVQLRPVVTKLTRYRNIISAADHYATRNRIRRNLLSDRLSHGAYVSHISTRTGPRQTHWLLNQVIDIV